MRVASLVGLSLDLNLGNALFNNEGAKSRTTNSQSIIRNSKRGYLILTESALNHRLQTFTYCKRCYSNVLKCIPHDGLYTDCLESQEMKYYFYWKHETRYPWVVVTPLPILREDISWLP